MATRRVTTAPGRPRMTAQERQWAAEDALRTLQRAQQISADKRLMGDVKKVARQQVKVASKFAK